VTHFFREFKHKEKCMDTKCRTMPWTNFDLSVTTTAQTFSMWLLINGM